MISLSVKTLLKHVVSVLFLLNSARFLSVKTSLWRVGCDVEFEFLCLSAQTVVFLWLRLELAGAFDG